MKVRFYNALIRKLLRFLTYYGGTIKKDNKYCTIVDMGFEDIVFPKFTTGAVDFYFYRNQELVHIFHTKIAYIENIERTFKREVYRRMLKNIKDNETSF